ncbi:amidohydrolase family protein [Vulgatibacter incomptus]|uniref:Exoenzymes regulatory protein AepA n=1 Tax=Vulgatibacter incomptus TaxID=1391653 RepID=A0A0K1PB41_9BACT|nr:amidohydrolase family protein [Vulgatibacter incomptus]AKU90707.1 Exoenzymes regulatory protein AepA precursor [Vulgatibacter incomptus]
MRNLAALAAGLLLIVSGTASADETLYYGGSIFTGEGEAPSARWFVVRDGAFAAVGDDPGVPEAWAHLESQVDLGGAFVAPGFVDAHIHFVDGGLGLLHTDLAGLHTEADLSRALAEAEARAQERGWILARGLVEGGAGAGEALGHVRRLLADKGPAFVTLAGGHHVFVNPAGLARLGIDAGTPDPEGGRIERGPDGTPTGLLVDAAAWSAQRAVYETFSPGLIARAMLRAQRRALAFGITAIGDNTFFPVHLALYERLAAAGHLHLRVSARSLGAEPMTRLLMSAAVGPRVRYFGEKHFVDESLSQPALDAPAKPPAMPPAMPGGEPHLTQAQLEETLLFAAGAGTAFHTQGREGAERLAAARLAVASRRPPGKVDVIDHCGSCGGDLPAKLKQAGLRVTVLPSQLYELPAFEKRYGAEATRDLLPLRALYDAGLEPALTSDWPHGYAADGTREALAPLSQVAVAVSGRTPAGNEIPGAASRTIPLAGALRGVTASAADTIGWSDLGRIGEGAAADFVILDRSPFGIPAAELHRLEVDATFIDGIPVFRRTDSREGRAMREAMSRAEALSASIASNPEDVVDDPLGDAEPVVARGSADGPGAARNAGATPEGARFEDGRGEMDAEATLDAEIASAFDSKPHSWNLSPIIGYDPTLGLFLGASLFVHSFEDEGWNGGGSAMYAARQESAQVLGNIQRRRAFGPVAAHLAFRFETLHTSFFGLGSDTSVDDSVETRPTWVELRPGLRLPLGRRWEAGVYASYAWLRERSADRIIELQGQNAGVVNGNYFGPRFELVWDGRDNPLSARKGSLFSAWTNTWLVQGGQDAPRLTMGATIAHFVPLRAPDWILALRLEGGTSVGDRGYLTDFTLGGQDRLRGYSISRFRGDHVVDGTAELRFPIWRLISGAAFADAGRVWAKGVPEPDRPLVISGGGGLRFGLPPEGLARLRLDAGFGRDEWGIFFTFGEAF